MSLLGIFLCIWIGLLILVPFIYGRIQKIQDKKSKKKMQDTLNSLPISEEMKQEMSDILKESDSI